MDDQPTAGSSNVLSPSKKMNSEVSPCLDVSTLEMDADPLALWKCKQLHFQTWLFLPESTYSSLHS